MLEKVVDFLQSNNIKYEENVLLSRKTWIRRGGKCKCFITPESSSQLKKLIVFLYTNDIHFFVLGHSSNVYILNSCDIDIVVSTLHCRNYKLSEKNYISCDAGVSVKNLARDMVKKGIIGFEYLTELPGTVGGALYNNSSCITNSLSELLLEVEFVRNDGKILFLTPNDLEFSFRSSILKEKRLEGTIISLKFKVEYGNPRFLEKIVEYNTKSRIGLIESNAHNLGCTVNRCFINGKMPLKYSIPSRIYNKILLIIEKDSLKRKIKSRDFLCKITGFSNLAKYISPKNIIIFMWTDDGADKEFPRYLDFMKKVFKTDKVEIEIIKKYGQD